MDDFQEEEKVVGYFDTDSGGILVTDMIWDAPQATQQRFAQDLELGTLRIPIKAVRIGNKRRLIIELDEGVDILRTQEVVEVTE